MFSFIMMKPFIDIIMAQSHMSTHTHRATLLTHSYNVQGTLRSHRSLTVWSQHESFNFGTNLSLLSSKPTISISEIPVPKYVRRRFFCLPPKNAPEFSSTELKNHVRSWFFFSSEPNVVRFTSRCYFQKEKNRSQLIPIIAVVCMWILWKKATVLCTAKRFYLAQNAKAFVWTKWKNLGVPWSRIKIDTMWIGYEQSKRANCLRNLYFPPLAI